MTRSGNIEEHFEDGEIAGVSVRSLHHHSDDRGWLAEIYRADEIAEEDVPVMAYISSTRPGVTRGPHEHVAQTDLFGFLGPSDFTLYLWDNRPDSKTHRRRMMLKVGERNPSVVLIPPGVVHAYKNIGAVDGWVINCANKLYRGPARAEEIDEIRHEKDPDTIYRID